MRILYAASDQKMDSIHGGTIHVNAVCRELLKYGHEIHLIIQRSNRSIDVPGGITVHRIPSTHRFLLWTAGKEIQRQIDDIKPDVVIERYYNFAGEAIIRSARSGIPTVLEVNSPMIEYPGSLKTKVDRLIFGRLQQRRERIGESASMIISPLKNIVPEKFHGKTIEIEWGADTNLFDPNFLPDKHLLRLERGFHQDDILLIHFGSLRKWHGVEKLIDAWNEAHKTLGNQVKLVVAGGSQSAHRKKAPHLHYAGSIPHQELPSWLKMSDAAVLPFAPEQHRYLELGFYWSPLKLFEAMAMELPVLTLEHPRLKQLLGSDNPLFYYDGTSRNLSEQIVSLVQQLAAVKTEAQNFRQRVLDLYSWEAHGKKLNAILEGFSQSK